MRNLEIDEAGIKEEAGEGGNVIALPLTDGEGGRIIVEVRAPREVTQAKLREAAVEIVKRLIRARK